MFVTIGTITQYVSEVAAIALLITPGSRKSTAAEAANCLNRMVSGGDSRMNEAQADFQRIYSKFSAVVPPYIALLQECAFALESISHLQGFEISLLLVAEKARDYVAQWKKSEGK